MKLHNEIARIFGYELNKIDTQSTLATHLKMVFNNLGVDTVLDVGANKGQFGRFLRKNGFKGELYSFEPLKEPFAILSSESEKDSKWHAINCGLGSEKTKCEINVTNTTEFASIRNPNTYATQMFNDLVEVTHQETIQLDTVDNFLLTNNDSFSNKTIFLKMDTQGYDLEVFKGASNSLSRIVALQSELSVQAIYDGMPGYLDALAVYSDNGYLPSGLYPVCRNKDGLSLLEVDAVLIKT